MISTKIGTTIAKNKFELLGTSKTLIDKLLLKVKLNFQVPGSSRKLHYRRSAPVVKPAHVGPQPVEPEPAPVEPQPQLPVLEPEVASDIAPVEPQPVPMEPEAEVESDIESDVELEEINKAMDYNSDSDYCSDFQDEEQNEQRILQFAKDDY